MVSSLGNVILFFDKLGVYDVVLPFLLVFTIVFAILEKTKILGTETIEGKEYTKKNLDSIVAFVIAFFVVASARLVAIINQVMANVVLLSLVSVSFLILIGTFHTGKKELFLTGGWRTTFMIIMFIGVILIFLNALGWLDTMWGFLTHINYSGEVIGTIVLLVIIIIFMWYITKSNVPSKKEEKKEEE